MADQLLPVLILTVVVVLFGAAMIGLAVLVGQKARTSTRKGMPYECGIPGTDTADTKTPVKFYLTAISFILFDVEVVFLYPWSLVFVDNIKTLGGQMIISMGVFIAILAFGLFYEWKAGALEWD